MKSSLTRISALVMALLLLALSLTVFGCSNKASGDDAATTTAAATEKGSDEEESTGPVYTFNDANYNGATFLVYQRSSTASSYAGLYIVAEDVSDLMSEAVFKRNEAVATKYNVKIESLEVSDPYKDVAAQIDGDLCEFSAILDRRCNLASLARKGYLKNFNDLDIDFSTPWWDANCAREYDINGKLFFMANDTSIANLAGARFFYFNKELIKSHNLENPYDLVEANQWTLEKFLSLVSAVAEDNGDGVKDGNDTFGLCVETGASNGNVMHLLTGCGVRYSEINSGSLITKINDQKTDDIIELVRTALVGTPCAITYGEAKKNLDTAGFANDYDFGRNLFANGHFLFIQGNMGVAVQFANMTDDYGAVVNPKYTADQPSYYHKMDKYSLIWAIPNVKNFDYEMIGNVMDFWAYKSSTSVMETYYEITIKTRRVQDPIASSMLDKVKASIVYDISDLFGITVADAVWSAYNGNTTLGATWKQYKTVVETNMNKLIADFDALD